MDAREVGIHGRSAAERTTETEDGDVERVDDAVVDDARGRGGGVDAARGMTDDAGWVGRA